MWRESSFVTGMAGRKGWFSSNSIGRRRKMGLIKSDRQLTLTRRTLGELHQAVEKLRAKHKGQALRLFTSGPLGMIDQLEREIREYQWLKKATPAQVMKQYALVRIEDIGPFLARLRIASGLTQEELARRMG